MGAPYLPFARKKDGCVVIQQMVDATNLAVTAVGKGSDAWTLGVRAQPCLRNLYSFLEVASCSFAECCGPYDVPVQVGGTYAVALADVAAARDMETTIAVGVA